VAHLTAGLYSLNSGVVSDLALARVDLQKLRVAASVQENLLPMVLGPAKFRPGTEYLTRTHDDISPLGMPFIVNAETKALIEVTTEAIRVLVDGVPVTRPSVTSTITNGTFDTDLTGWTDADEGSAASTWATGGYLQLLGTGASSAIRTQEATVVETGTEHAVRVVVNRGPVIIKIGSGAGLDDYITETTLRTGTHSLGFTPTGNFHITLMCSDDVPRLIDSVTIEAAGVMTLPSPWDDNYFNLRHDQSGDVLFLACSGHQQQRIERRSQRAWSICDYEALDGPFRFINATNKTITPSAIEGSITLLASHSLFKSSHVGSLWRMTHFGQTTSDAFSGVDESDGYIRVVGIGAARAFSVTLSGTFVATVTLQRSVGEPGAWEFGTTYSAAGTVNENDGLDNQIIYYRLVITGGNYTSGTVNAVLSYAAGSQTGIARVTAYTSDTMVNAEVLSDFGRITATTDWEESVWSDYRGWPAAVAFHDGRLWWAFRDSVYGSVSDAFDSYDDTVEGDSGPVIRSVATGGIEGILWLLSMQRFLAATSSQEISMRASSFDEPITPTAFTARAFSNRGSANIQAVKIDSRAIYVQRNGTRVFEAIYSVDAQDYGSSDATRLAPDICSAGIVGMAVQRQPDTRVWLWLDDGTAAVLTYEPGDEVVCWTTITTTGLIKWITVLPGEDDDEVYWSVERQNGTETIMTWERMAQHSECEGETLSKNIDAHVVYEGAASATITGLDHLEGLSVVAWGDETPYPGPFTVIGGQVTLPAAVENAVVGLGYAGRFRSSKLAQGAVAGTALSRQKRIDHVSLIMNKVGWYGVSVGKDFDNMHRLPATLNNGRPLVATEVIENWDGPYMPFNGGFGPDERVCFKINSPYPATFMGVVIAMATNEPSTFGANVSQGAGG
jgi:hypothetical protein